MPATLSRRNAAFLLLLFGVPSFANEGKAHLSGEVSRGREYRREIGFGLIFVLKPSDTGWTIQVVPAAPCESPGDWASVVNAPYRNYNALYVDASYGITAQEAVNQMNPREFSFVTTCADYKAEAHRLDVVLWPASYSKEEADSARNELGTSPLGKARFTIVHSKVSRAEEDIEGTNYGKIDWLRFKLDVTFPTHQQRRTP